MLQYISADPKTSALWYHLSCPTNTEEQTVQLYCNTKAPVNTAQPQMTIQTNQNQKDSMMQRQLLGAASPKKFRLVSAFSEAR